MFRSVYLSSSHSPFEQLSGGLAKIISGVDNFSCALLPIVSNKSSILKHQQVRTTFIVQRRHPIGPHAFDSTFDNRKPRKRHRIYDELPESKVFTEPKPVKIILISPIEGLGGPGDGLEVAGPIARRHLLLGAAVYSTPENIEKYAHLKDGTHDSTIPSSPFVFKTMKYLYLSVISVSMNMETPWVLEKWHLRVAFRKAGICVTDNAIQMPEKEISGPDLSLQGKEFIVRLKLNNKETASARCRIHHVSTDMKNRIKWEERHWELSRPALFPEEAQELKEMTMAHPKYKESDLD